MTVRDYIQALNYGRSVLGALLMARTLRRAMDYNPFFTNAGLDRPLCVFRQLFEMPIGYRTIKMLRNIGYYKAVKQVASADNISMRCVDQCLSSKGSPSPASEQMAKRQEL